MTGGSDDARPPQGERDAIDDGWNALVEEAGSEEDAARKRDLPVSGPHTAVGVDRLADPDGEMDQLMSGAADKSLSGPIVAATDEVSVREVVPKPMFVPPGSKSSRSVDVGAPTSASRPAEADRPSLRVVTGGSDVEATPEPASAPAPTPAPVSAPARAERPAEPISPEPGAPSAPTSGGLRWMWIAAGAVVVLGAAGYFATRTGDSDRPDPPGASATAASPGGPDASNPSAPSVEPGSSTVSGGSAGGSGASSEGGASDNATSPKAVKPSMPITRSGDPREPPSGTPPEIAAVFRRLPVSPSDGPPIGGIGANGIHIDELTMGSRVSGGTCSGHVDDFSISASDRAGVCVRVVHPREKDELQVLWQKHGGSTRRSSMVVGAKHAYRTRGYLKLRKEYIGDWTVRILSSDGVELARHDFTIVP